MSYQATGYSLVYNQLYPFEGAQNYTSGIIHHVRLTGTIRIHCVRILWLLFPVSSCSEIRVENVAR